MKTFNIDEKGPHCSNDRGRGQISRDFGLENLAGQAYGNNPSQIKL